ncbi:hypothetical protein [Colwellia piezophila]|uniref:hypothetical protein n=1 Tax=Colwellia piezophila TaxID=211668 RepID=UPI000372E216|nr:hypothetical protein [Colwellia piezophila]
MQTLSQIINSVDFDGTIEMSYSLYQSSRKRHYPLISDIKLVGDGHEVRRMTAWISQHFPVIRLTQEVFYDNAEDYNRAAIEERGEAALSAYGKFRYDEFWRISSALSTAVGFSNLFDVDHAKSIKENGIAAIEPDNLNLMLFRANKKKSAKSHPRYSWARQEEVIWSSIKAVTELTSDDERVVELLVQQLKSLY